MNANSITDKQRPILLFFSRSISPLYLGNSSIDFVFDLGKAYGCRLKPNLKGILTYPSYIAVLSTYGITPSFFTSTCFYSVLQICNDEGLAIMFIAAAYYFG